MIVVVGSGIIGLSVAEFLTRSGERSVTIVSSSHFSPASQAAAANLATKAQAFARDPHFAIKLAGKMKYPEWLEKLRAESAFNGSLSSIYSCGVGRDLFESQELADRQWMRVRQDEAQIAAWGLPPQKLRRIDGQTIECDDEAWVDAASLLRMLESVCRKRGVVFHEADVRDIESWSRELQSAEAVVLCAGAGTVQILESWPSVELPPAFSKSLRWSFGGTLTIHDSGVQLGEGVALLEKVGSSEPSKVTFSGAHGTLFCSSVSIPCVFPHRPMSDGDPALQNISLQQDVVFRKVREVFGIEPQQKRWEWKWGHRLGFGHREWLVERVPHSLPHLKGPLVVAAGVHKSGYLAAPLMGELVMQKLQGEIPFP
ncbi:MAG: hypothetical protein RIR26_853 [Pseudomonadota bacterium]